MPTIIRKGHAREHMAEYKLLKELIKKQKVKFTDLDIIIGNRRNGVAGAKLNGKEAITEEDIEKLTALFGIAEDDIEKYFTPTINEKQLAMNQNIMERILSMYGTLENFSKTWDYHLKTLRETLESDIPLPIHCIDDLIIILNINPEDIPQYFNQKGRSQYE